MPLKTDLPMRMIRFHN